jgi:hypothetical protein
VVFKPSGIESRKTIFFTGGTSSGQAKHAHGEDRTHPLLKNPFVLRFLRQNLADEQRDVQKELLD